MSLFLVVCCMNGPLTYLLDIEKHDFFYFLYYGFCQFIFHRTWLTYLTVVYSHVCHVWHMKSILKTYAIYLKTCSNLSLNKLVAGDSKIYPFIRR